MKAAIVDLENFEHFWTGFKKCINCKCDDKENLRAIEVKMKKRVELKISWRNRIIGHCLVAGEEFASFFLIGFEASLRNNLRKSARNYGQSSVSELGWEHLRTKRSVKVIKRIISQFFDAARTNTERETTWDFFHLNSWEGKLSSWENTYILS